MRAREETVDTWWMALVLTLCGFQLVEGVLLLGILRQLGVLHRRADGLSTATSSNPLAMQGLDPGTLAPDFTLPRVGDMEGSTAITLSNFRGRPVLLAFVSPHCGPCHGLLPQLNAFAEGADPASLQVLAISSGDRDSNEELRTRNALRVPLLLQEGREVADRYKALVTPYAYVIDARGTVRARQIVNSGEDVSRLLRLAGEGEHDGRASRASRAISRAPHLP